MATPTETRDSLKRWDRACVRLSIVTSSTTQDTPKPINKQKYKQLGKKIIKSINETENKHLKNRCPYKIRKERNFEEKLQTEKWKIQSLQKNWAKYWKNTYPNQNAIHRKNTKIKSKDIQIVHGSHRTLINNKQLKAWSMNILALKLKKKSKGKSYPPFETKMVLHFWPKKKTIQK